MPLDTSYHSGDHPRRSTATGTHCHRPLDTSYHSGDHPRRMQANYEEYRAWSGENQYVEWVNGEILIYRAPYLNHQRLLGFLLMLLSEHVRKFNLGEVIMIPFEMRLVPDRISRAPDIVFVAREHLDRLTEDRLEGPADLVIEIICEDSVARDRDDKFYEYQAAGVPEYWIIDSRRGKERIDCYRLMPDGTYLAVLPDDQGHYRTPFLPGFWFDPAWLRQNPRPKKLDVLRLMLPEE
jgi:Uma2 family endonuclease